MSLPHIAIGSWFAARAERSPGRRALTFEGVTRTYAEVLDRADRFATALAAGGVRDGDRVAFLGNNQPAFLDTLLATVRLGAAFVPLNYRLAGPEVGAILTDADVHTVVVDRDNRVTLDGLKGRISRVIGVEDDYETLVESAERLANPRAVESENMAVLMYTSGTTGTPKGVMLSHANLWWSAINLSTSADVLEDDVTLTMAPLFHIAGLNVTTLLTWMKGGEVILHRTFDVDAVFDDIETYRVNTLFGVPAMFAMLEQAPRFATADLSSLRMLNCGGAPVPEALLRSYLARGITVQQGYGLTESAPTASVLTSEWALTKLGSAGRPPLYGELKLEVNGRRVTTAGERGEICLRGPHITAGYWNRPEATASVLEDDGWFHTGDIGHLDEDGFLYIVDRLKDVIISGGENVYPAEVENVLHRHPDILEAAVVGMPDEEWGETVAAYVVLQEDSSLDLTALREFAAASLARYKLPRRMQIQQVLPHTASGKVLKTRLRAET